jgi:peptidoglycan hydrolase-like protein with peptidoglycan-binding domain
VGLIAASAAGLVYQAFHWAQPPVALAWISCGALSVVGVALLAWWQNHPGRHLVTGSVVVGLMGGGAIYALRAPAQSQGPLDPNRQTAERVVRLKQALERRGDYRSSQATTSFYPPTRDFLTFAASLQQGPALIVSPWGDVPQRTMPPPDRALGLPTAAQRHAGISAPALGADLGPGAMPTQGRFTANTYGALIYDRDDRTGRYILYGIGRRGDAAVLVGVAEGEP